jgi:probable F420-dependent oxidoreductase
VSATSVRIGAKLPNTGALPIEPGVPTLARRIEAAGFDSLWTSDHVVMVDEHSSPYPYSSDGSIAWDPSTPWFDAIAVLAAAGAVTERVSLGVAVLILPLRQPIVLAKQLASLDAMSHGRIVLGVGVGWLAEEFAALDVPFETRGARTDEWIELLRSAWTGRPAEFAGVHYHLPAGVVCSPVPAHDIPILIGGGGGPAWRRAGRSGDGWLCQQNVGGFDPPALRTGLEAMQRAAIAAGRSADDVHVVLRVGSSAGRAEEVAASLPDLIDVGVREVIVDIDWDDPTGAVRAHDTLREAIHG